MAWSVISRLQHMRTERRYPSDLRDGKWALIEPMFPAACSGGRPRATCVGAVMGAILFIVSSGCAWAMLPKCFPPASTVRGYFYVWRDSGLLATINHLLVMTASQQAGREASPTAGVIDSQSVKTTESCGISGFEAGKKVKGRKRHIITDTCGFRLFVLIHAADIQDRDGAPDLLKALPFRSPGLRRVFADGGYAEDKPGEALNGHGSRTLQIIKRSDNAKGFVLLPRHRVVERTFAWLGRCRHLANDWEHSIASSTAWANIASVRMLTRRIAKPSIN